MALKAETEAILTTFCREHSFSGAVRKDFLQAFSVMLQSYQNRGKLLICGNGGSAADADHIAGELVKAFRLKRPLTAENLHAFEPYGPKAVSMAKRLQGSLPAVNLCAHTALITAIINDLGADVIFAQQVLGYGHRGDVLLGISTSGNSEDVLDAGIVAKTKEMKTILLTGKDGGSGKSLFDISVIAPSDETSDIQDMHSVIYHVWCAMLESELWEK